ncbi:MAG: DNA-binding protein [Abditibacteriota bacterium]|nr:DNA-binding protein [Abditibacteriota bacterium]
MEYTQGKTGRVFVARLHEDENIYEEVNKICVREAIRYAYVQAMGAIKNADGSDKHELVGLGTVVPDANKPVLHFHAGIGSDVDSYVGHPNPNIKVHLNMEVLLTELVGMDMARVYEPEVGSKTLTILGKGTDYSERSNEMKGSFSKSYK